MAKVRKGCSYRRLERPYTRVSKFKKKTYVKARPNIHIVKYDMGETNKKFPFIVNLLSKIDLQIRHNSLEAARQTSNRLLERTMGKSGYHLKVRVFPHHILRENPLAAGAGADRMSTGMKNSFGKPIGTAARVKKGQAVFSVYTTKDKLAVAKHALKRASYKLAGSYIISASKNE